MGHWARMFLFVFTLVLQLLLGESQTVTSWEWKPNTAPQPVTTNFDSSGKPLPKWFTDLQMRRTLVQVSSPVQPVHDIPKGYTIHTEFPAGSTAVLPVPDIPQGYTSYLSGTIPVQPVQAYGVPYPTANQVNTNLPNLELQDRKESTGTISDAFLYRPPPAPPTPPDEGPNNNACPRDVIHDRYRGQGYFFSWEDRRSKYLNLTWAAAIQFCKARCLELVSIETKDEDAFLARHIRKWRQTDVWTSGRKCDFRGCENPNLQPIDIYGWFWEGSRTQLPPTTDLFDVNWSDTGALGKPQPDNREGLRGGENESCLAIRNDAYNDGIRWHDEVCSKRVPFICEERRGSHSFLGYIKPESTEINN